MSEVLLTSNQHAAAEALMSRRGRLMDTVEVIQSKYGPPLPTHAIQWAKQNLDDGLYLGRYSIANDTWQFIKLKAEKMTEIDICSLKELAPN